MGSNSIITQIIDFIVELIQSMDSGYLFFGSAWDLVRYAADILLVAALFYMIMIFIKQTRAWQLIKGIVLILLFVLLCGLLGLEMVGFIFNKLLYVLAILFIVLFQPELRRVLETVGLRSFSSFKGFFFSTEVENPSDVSVFIKEICHACSEMSSTNTGALILVERNTRLDELLTQENVVRFDSTVSSSVLQSIFYKGSPMHDGGLLIRNGRIIAARCHVPLSVTMHELSRTGTRHRAAVGASEMGDTVVIVVSEERGQTSIAVNGRLYEMKDATELEANLSYLLGVGEGENIKKGFFSRIFKSSSEKKVRPVSASAISHPVTEAEGEKKVKIEIKTKTAEKRAKVGGGYEIVQRIVLMIVALFMSTVLWMYIQVNNNPVVSKVITVPISYDTTMTPENMEVSYPIETVEVILVGRKNTMDTLTASDVSATIDYSAVTDPGVVELPIIVESSDSKVYFRVEQQVPETISVTVYAQSEPSEN
ncbi:MAG: diadenylate cyclase [Clostridiales bacterium]|nr:diadenylate cyclase [Clostridiales bacterium]